MTIPLYVCYRLTGRRAIVRIWARASARIIGLRIRVSGSIPARGFVVANHLSYLDVLTIGSQLDACFVAKADIGGWPIFGWLARGTGTIFLDRKSARDLPRVAEKMRQAAAAGRVVVLFPEGTSSDGTAVQPFRPALLEVPASTTGTLHPAVLGYRTPDGEPDAAESVCWWGGMTFPPHLWRLLGLRRIEGWIEFLDPVTGSSRAELAERSREAIAAALDSRQGESKDERRTQNDER